MEPFLPQIFVPHQHLQKNSLGDISYFHGVGGSNLVGVAHNPVCEVVHHLVTELHLLAEGEVVPSLHHYFHQLAQFGLDV